MEIVLHTDIHTKLNQKETNSFSSFKVCFFYHFGRSVHLFSLFYDPFSDTKFFGCFHEIKWKIRKSEGAFYMKTWQERKLLF